MFIDSMEDYNLKCVMFDFIGIFYTVTNFFINRTDVGKTVKNHGRYFINTPYDGWNIIIFIRRTPIKFLLLIFLQRFERINKFVSNKIIKEKHFDHF